MIGRAIIGQQEVRVRTRGHERSRPCRMARWYSHQKQCCSDQRSCCSNMTALAWTDEQFANPTRE